MKTLNTFLRKLPELVVDSLTFRKDESPTNYLLHSGFWKFRKVGYNEYSLSKQIDGKFLATDSWHTDAGCGDLNITGIRLSPLGVRVLLGDDVPDPDNQ